MARVLNIFISLFLLGSLGFERLIPCEDDFDICSSAEAVAEGSCHVDELGELDNDRDSDGEESHDNHNCFCPCHTVALSPIGLLTASATSGSDQHLPFRASLRVAFISPAEPVPIV